jgi:hypothetical protein
VIDVHAAFREQLFDVSVRESVAEVPADGQQDHVRREPIAGERSGDRSAVAIHQGTLRLTPDRSTQQCLWSNVRHTVGSDATVPNIDRCGTAAIAVLNPLVKPARSAVSASHAMPA